MEKTKPKPFTVISWVAVIACCTVIFILSAQDSTESAELSTSVFAGILNKLFVFLKLDDDEIRTLAHWLEYCGLGLLTCNAVIQTRKRNIILSWGIAVVYSITDEIHQIFVPGRTFQIIDIAVDAFGATVGTAVCLLIYLTVKKIVSKVKHEKE